jgi:hypothetical protein
VVLSFPSITLAQTRDDMQVSSRDEWQPSTSRFNPFVAGTFGNERRTFGDGVTRATFAQLLGGLRGGLQIQILPGLMLAPVAGIAKRFEDRDVSPYAEMEVNHTFHNGGYAGTGVGVWDISRAQHQNATTLLIHFGLPLVQFAPGRARVLLTYESRLFFSGLSNNIENNYQALLGLRYVLGR